MVNSTYGRFEQYGSRGRECSFARGLARLFTCITLALTVGMMCQQPLSVANTGRTGAPVSTHTQGSTQFDADSNVHRIPLFPAAWDSNGEGFIRVINRSDEAGKLSIAAIDDAGSHFEGAALAIGAGETAHFNSRDLELGNADKGLTGGLGVGVGDGYWRLELSSGLDIAVLAYIRAGDGFLTAMHDVVERGANGHRVGIFNPGQNDRQTSLLRLINPGASEAEVVISGIDDAGRVSDGTVSVSLPGFAARMVSAADLESEQQRGDTDTNGDNEAGLEGALGTGSGKWQLLVDSDQPVVVMSLLMSPTGHVTNLSTAPYRKTRGVSLIRRLEENTHAGTAIGEPVTADFGANTALTHTLEGPDAESFDIDGSSGQLRAREQVTYDFETRSTFDLIVMVTDGLGGVERIGVIVEVTNVAEPPGQLAPPEVEGVSSRSVRVSWLEPENTGPPITDYDVEYRRPGAAEYTDAGHDGTGREIEIERLRQGASYEFRVRASNAEGIGEWSEPSLGRSRSGGGGGGVTPPPPPPPPPVDVPGPTIENVAFTDGLGGYKLDDIIEVTVTFSEAVAVTGTPQIGLLIGSTLRRADYVNGPPAMDLIFRYRVAATDEDTDGVTVNANGLTLNGGSIRKNDSNVDADLAHDAHQDPTYYKRVDGIKPELWTAAVHDDLLVLTYGERIWLYSTPATSDFVVKVSGAPRTVSEVSVGDRAVTLLLASAIMPTDQVTLSYTPGNRPIRDKAGNSVAPLTDRPVTTSAPFVSRMEITSAPSTRQTYRGGDVISVTVTFTENVTVLGAPRILLSFDGSSSGREKVAEYVGGSGSAALLFRYTVAEGIDAGIAGILRLLGRRVDSVGDLDNDGMSIPANGLEMHGGTIRDSDNHDAALVLEEVMNHPDHKVDGVWPELVTDDPLVVNGATLTMHFDELLDETSAPEVSAFAVTVSAATGQVSGVSIDEDKVTLTLLTAVTSSDEVAVSYTAPSGSSATPIQDLVGNNAQDFTERMATNQTTQ